jgi:endonuclease G
LAQDGNQLYIIAGAFGTGGTGRLGVLQSITNGKVNVPQMFWKVRVISPEVSNDLSRAITSTRAIAVCMPNKQGIRNTDWHSFVTTIRNVEAATGYNFLSKSSQSVQDAIETRRDSSATGPVSSNPCRL